jgi:hypothetical protein
MAVRDGYQDDDMSAEYYPGPDGPADDEITPDGAPSQIWLEVTTPMREALSYIHKCIATNDWEPVAIINFAEASSNAIEKDIVDHPEWTRMDRDRRYGEVPLEYGKKMTPEHFLARYRLIRELLRKYNVVGRKAPQGDPARFLSFSSLVPRVTEDDR